MTTVDVFFIGVGLSMDALALTLSHAMNPGKNPRRLWVLPLAFGLFQGLMPLAGYFIGEMFVSWLNRISGWLVLAILGALGVKMLIDFFRSLKGEDISCGEVCSRLVVCEAIATSIDALAVGVSFAALEGPVVLWSGIIALVTAVLCAAAIPFGRKFGDLLGNKAPLIGGILLILIAVKSVL